LFCGEALVGVIASYPTEFDGRVLRATPITAVANDPRFCDALGWPCPLPLIDVFGTGRLSPPPLPPPLQRFVGRDNLLADLVSVVLANDSRRLLLHGGPGIGKTALSLAAVHHADVVARFGDRRFFVRLEAVTQGPAVLAAVGLSLGLAEGSDLPARAVRALKEAQSLLVLDNLETPWTADGAGTQAALDQCAAVPGVTILATVRGSEQPGRLRACEPMALVEREEPVSQDRLVTVEIVRRQESEGAAGSGAAIPGRERLRARGHRRGTQGRASA
jgi:hypothetical protein